MNTEKLIIDIFQYIFEAFVFWLYAGMISNPKKKNSISISCIILGYSILLLIYEFNNLLATGLSIIVICTGLFKLFYSMSFKNSLFQSFILFGVMVGSEFASMSIVTLITKAAFDIQNISSNVYFADVVISRLVYFIILVIIGRIFAKKENKEHNSKPYWIMLIMPLSSIIMMTIFRNISISSDLSSKNYILWVFSALLVLFSNIIV